MGSSGAAIKKRLEFGREEIGDVICSTHGVNNRRGRRGLIGVNLSNLRPKAFESLEPKALARFFLLLSK